LIPHLLVIFFADSFGWRHLPMFSLANYLSSSAIIGVITSTPIFRNLGPLREPEQWKKRESRVSQTIHNPESLTQRFS
jgi:hypothetical protein